MSDLRYGRPESDADVQALREVIFRSFVAEDGIEVIDPWMERTGRDNLRCLWEGKRVVAGLFLVPMGQCFGGRAVRTAGVAGVGVGPEDRGRRLGHELMQRAHAELRADGWPLTTLYASTFGLYRSVGYERAGSRFEARVGLRDIRVRDRELAVRPLVAADRPAVEALTDAWALRHNGHLARGPYVRDRIEHPYHVKAVHSWGVLDGERLVGLARWHQKRAGDGSYGFYDLQLLDLAAESLAAVRRLLTLFADHSSIGGDLVWASGPTDPFLLALPERFWRLRLNDLWMLRLLDVDAALEGRGWAAGAAGELHLDVEDELLPENAGPRVVTVEGGRAHVARGGEGRVRLHARALAPLYSGFLSAEALALQGWAAGPEADLALASTLFAAPAPWMHDMF